MKTATSAALLATLLYAEATLCHAQQQAAPGHAEEGEPKAIIEIGAAGEWALTHGSPAYGPNLAVEFTPIKEKLEIEAGVKPFFSRGQTEWDTDLLLKKPYTVSKTVEFMCGAGPEWAHTIQHGKSSNSFAVEGALDFMFWPWPKRRFGWYVEPSYGYSFAGGHQQSATVTVGLLIPVR